MNSAKNFGDEGEMKAADFLQKKGFEILARNFHAREGEVDLVARDGAAIVFVEVKARRSAKFGAAIEAVSEAKLARIAAAGEKWLTKNSLENAEWRVDVVTLDGQKIEHFRGV